MAASLPTEMLEQIAAYVADAALAHWCATSRPFQGAATSMLTRRVVKVIQDAKDVTPGEHNSTWPNGFDDPPPVVAARQKHIMHVDLSTSTLDKIGAGCFRDCESLKSVKLPDSVVTIGVSAFQNCGALVSIGLPQKLTTIQATAFAFCESLPTLDLPPSITSIYDRAFYHCSALESVTLPSSLTTLTKFVFHACRALESVTFAEPASLREMGGYNFMYCGSLASIELPSSLRKIDGLHTFEGCFCLKSVRLPALVPLEHDTLDCCMASIEQYGPKPILHPKHLFASIMSNTTVFDTEYDSESED